MKSIAGRPRLVSDAQVEKILTWHASRKRMVQLAAEIRVSTSTIYNVIKRGGVYKQVSPELRDITAGWRRARNDRLRTEGWM